MPLRQARRTRSQEIAVRQSRQPVVRRDRSHDAVDRPAVIHVDLHVINLVRLPEQRSYGHARTAGNLDFQAAPRVGGHDATASLQRNRGGTQHDRLAVDPELKTRTSRILAALPVQGRLISNPVVADTHGDGRVDAHAGAQAGVRIGGQRTGGRHGGLPGLQLHAVIAQQHEFPGALEVVAHAVDGLDVRVAFGVRASAHDPSPDGLERTSRGSDRRTDPGKP